MEVKQTESGTITQQTVLENSEYFKYIFKKSEKLACAVFYILRSDNNASTRDSVVNDLEGAARSLLMMSLKSLKAASPRVGSDAIDMRHELVAFEAMLRMAHAARIISTELLQVFLHEIDSVQRSLRKFIEPTIKNPLVAEDIVPHTRERKIPRAPRTLAVASPSGLPYQSRRDRVIGVLKDRGEATIKDITEVISDCSEKTIQRELIGLIKDNVVLREGERRWSKYKLVV